MSDCIFLKGIENKPLVSKSMGDVALEYLSSLSHHTLETFKLHCRDDLVTKEPPPCNIRRICHMF